MQFFSHYSKKTIILHRDLTSSASSIPETCHCFVILIIIKNIKLLILTSMRLPCGGSIAVLEYIFRLLWNHIRGFSPDICRFIWLILTYYTQLIICIYLYIWYTFNPQNCRKNNESKTYASVNIKEGSENQSKNFSNHTSDVSCDKCHHKQVSSGNNINLK
jgi:cbb3-type cytochrome oxidase subunit 3